MLTTLKNAINDEKKTTSDQKSQQLEILKDGAENLSQDQLNSLIHQNFDSLSSSYSQEAIDSLKELAVYRIQNNLSIHPFAGHQSQPGPCLY